MFCFLLVASLFHTSLTISLQEETALNNPFTGEDEPSYLYLDSRASKNKDLGDPRDTEIEARRRSTMARNFVRLGRRDMMQPIRSNFDIEYDDYVDDFNRGTRGNDRSDHFIRFGRGRSDFVRFGRDQTPARQPSSYFRLGRSTDSEKKRNKREAPGFHPEAKRQSNFVRFGRAQHNFMRFGREPAGEEIFTEQPGVLPRQSELEILKDYEEAKFIRFLIDLAMQLNHNPSLVKCQKESQ